MSGMMKTLVANMAMLDSMNKTMDLYTRSGLSREERKVNRLHEYATHKADKNKKAKRKSVQRSKRRNR